MSARGSVPPSFPIRDSADPCSGALLSKSKPSLSPPSPQSCDADGAPSSLNRSGSVVEPGFKSLGLRLDIDVVVILGLS